MRNKARGRSNLEWPLLLRFIQKSIPMVNPTGLLENTDVEWSVTGRNQRRGIL